MFCIVRQTNVETVSPSISRRKSRVRWKVDSYNGWINKSRLCIVSGEHRCSSQICYLT